MNARALVPSSPGSREALAVLASLTVLLATGPMLALADDVVVRVEVGDDLSRILEEAVAGTRVELAPGTHRLRPHPIVEPTCGNCEDPDTPVTATVGAIVTADAIRLVGDEAGSTIHTGSGYGLLFDGCHGGGIENVTVTGGTRDRDPNATSAAIVIKHGSVEVIGCRIEDNIGDPEIVREIVVGIIGIAVREGGELWAHGNVIRRNSWDGIALYRGALAEITDNVVDGVDAARGGDVGGGRGVGIGVTWDAHALIKGNLVRNYWKGIGLFVDAYGEVSENIVEDVLTWGISLWDAGKGAPQGRIWGNAVYRTGACGISIVRSDDTEPSGALDGNIVVETGQDPRYDSGEPYCEQTAIARHAVPEHFEITDNVLWRNREPDDAPGRDDVAGDDLPESAGPTLSGLGRHESLWRSAFLIRFGS